MINRIRNWTSSISTKLILIFIIVIIPVYILGLGIFNWGYEMVKNEISNTMISQEEFYLNTLESEISRMRNLQYECLNDENLLYLVNASQIMSDYEITKAMLSVQNRLSIMKNSSIYIENVSVHIPSIKKTISAIGGVSDLTDDWYKISRTSADKSDAGIIYYKNRMYLNVQYLTPIQYRRKYPLFALEIKLSDSELKNRLLVFTKYQNSGTLLINYNNGYELDSNPEDPRIKEIRDKVNQSKMPRDVGTYSIFTGNGEYQIAYKNSKYLNLKLAAYIPKDQVYAPIKKYQILFIIFTVASAIIMFFFFISTRSLIHKPLKKLVNSFKQLEKGDLGIRIEHRHSDEFQYLYKSFNAMVMNLSELIEQVYKQKILAQRSELKQLQSQINPHFLYNSFYILYRMAKDEDHENIVRFSQHLAEYYRYITRNSSDEVILLREVAHAKTYSDIQAMRFYNRIDIEFGELSEKYGELSVPRLIIQPIIENAFEHGVKDNTEKALIKVEFIDLKNGICVVVQDNGAYIDDPELEQLRSVLKDEDDKIECTAIINIHRRLKLKFGNGSGISLFRSELGGLKVIMNIFTQGDEMNA